MAGTWRDSLPQAERDTFLALLEYHDPAYGEDIFRNYYRGFVVFRWAQLYELTDDVPDWTLSWTGNVDLCIMFVSAFFVDADTAKIRTYRWNHENFFVHLRDAFRTGKWLTIGKFNYRLENNAITGITVGDVYATSPSRLTESRWTNPVKVPAITLNRFPLRDP